MSRKGGHRAQSYSGRLREIREINRRYGDPTFEINLERPTWPVNPDTSKPTPGLKTSPDGTLSYEPPSKGPEGK